MGHTYRGGKSGGELLTLFDSYSYDGVSDGGGGDDGDESERRRRKCRTEEAAASAASA